MTLCRNFFLSYKSLATSSTLLTVGKTCFGTGCILACYKLFAMTLCREFLRIGLATNLTGSSLRTGVSTIGINCYNVVDMIFIGHYGITVVPSHGVANAVRPGLDVRSLISITTTVILYTVDNKSGDVCRNNDLIYVVAINLTNNLGKSLTGPTCVISLIFTVPVVNGNVGPKPIVFEVNCYVFAKVIVTTSTLMIYKGMTLCRNFFLICKSNATYRTHLTIGKTCFGTSSSLACNGLLGVTKCGNNLLNCNDLTTVNTLFACSKTFLGTGSSLCLAESFLIFVKALNVANVITVVTGLVAVIIVNVTGSKDNILSYKSLATCGTLLTFGKTCFGTSSSLAGNNLIGMTECINHYVISGKLCITNRTVNYVIIRTYYGTGGSNVVFYNCVSVGVTKCRNCFLLYLVITYCAVLTLGKTAFGTGSSLSLILYDGVTKCRNCFLSYLVITYCAVLTRSETCFGTSGSLSLILYDGVTKCRNCFLLYLVITYCTVLTRSETCFGTSGILSLILYDGVTKCRNCFLSYLVITYCTVLTRSETCFGTSGILSLILYDGVTKCRNCFLSYLVITYCAVLTRSETCFGTGCILACIYNESVTKSGNYFLRYLVITYDTMLTCRKTCFSTGSSNCCVCNGLVTKSSNFLLSKEGFATCRALLTGGKTCLCTGCSLSCYSHLGVAKSLDHLRSLNFILAFSICEHLSTFTGEVFFQAGL